MCKEEEKYTSENGANSCAPVHVGSNRFGLSRSAIQHGTGMSVDARWHSRTQGIEHVEGWGRRRNKQVREGMASGDILAEVLHWPPWLTSDLAAS